ncbi:hypothetical protein FDP41_011245 [Naegleria fowleri]|uniref:Uncharacterized protein n=1 Tax=Naegleria fowleri TaxID=5763 RepID=A0A6A5CAB5_NAEFO|nr:uncharacterized protein FDP41_011245 [Naegleria fowleri]KAF0982315.1 hypothetical protein FDP41_011245 [Naegleria fowleri]
MSWLQIIHGDRDRCCQTHSKTFYLLLTALLFLSMEITVIHSQRFQPQSPNTLLQTFSNVKTLNLLSILSDPKSSQEILKTSRVIGVSEYVFLFVWRNKFMQRFKHIVQKPETLNDLFDKISPMMTNDSSSNSSSSPPILAISSDSSYFRIFNEPFMKSQFPGNYNIKTKAISSNRDCLTGNTMVDVDAFIQTSSPSVFKRFKDNAEIIDHTGQWTSLQDLWIYPLSPRIVFLLPIVNPMESWNETLVVSFLQNAIQNQTKYLNIPQECGNENILNRDSAWMKYGFSFLNFTPYDMDVFGKLWNVSILYDQKYLSQVFQSGELGSVTFNQTIDSVLSMISASNCNYCPYSICIDLDEQDYASYIAIGITILYYIIFFSTGMFKNYAMKRRLILPYLPIFGILRNWSNTSLSQRVCFSLFRIVPLGSVLVVVAVYFATTIRFFYLRNLYTFMTKTTSRDSWTKVHRVMGSALAGILLSVLAALVFNIVVLIPISSSLVVMEIYQGINYTGVAVVILAVLMSTGTFIVDAILNRTNIKRFGIYKFLLFDDPFYLRIDLICTVLILLFLIIYIITSTIVGVVYAVMDVFISICIIQVCGGNVMLLELAKHVLFKKRKAENGELEHLMRHNKEFYALISEYSAKEFSYENIAFF